jgi:diguanylate cyclase (GGDEF)-like protein/PAS domain S-box-containing protein
MNDVDHEFSREFHWFMDMLQTIDVGLCVFDKNYDVKLWNGFMENHSGVSPQDIKGQNLFDAFPELPEQWFMQKAETVFLLGTRTFATWELRPWLFQFKNYRPITGVESYMRQNVTFAPLSSVDGQIEHVCLILYDVTDVASNRKALEEANTELETLSRTDRLTGLNNRGYWEECLKQEYQRLERYGGDCALVIFDIDHFKKVNDTYGHPAGDEAIRQVSKLLQAVSRGTDVCGRYGGEEFVVILPGTKQEGALLFCERLREGIEGLTIQHEELSFQFTISLGVCLFEPGIEWLQRADEALYQSKDGGRNRTSVWNG